MWIPGLSVRDLIDLNESSGRWPWPRYVLQSQCICGLAIRLSDFDTLPLKCQGCGREYRVILEEVRKSGPEKEQTSIPVSRAPGSSAPAPQAQAPQASKGPLRASEV